MNQITRKAYAKINLGLDVLRKRPDGYHELRMVMQTVGIYDVLSFQKSRDGIQVITSHKELPCDKENLIYRAAELIRETYGIQEGVTITLQKNIPIAAGMAGGSTDAAAVFHGMKELFGLSMSIGDMQKLGVKIGADVPYCIVGGSMLSEGIGEILTPLPAPPDVHLLVAKPDINVSTGFVFRNLHADTLSFHPDIDGMVRALKDGDLKGITDKMGNVLETVTMKEYPVIEQIKEEMIKQGAENALMSGSGPTVFGIYRDRTKAQQAAETIEKKGYAGQIFVTDFIQTETEGR